MSCNNYLGLHNNFPQNSVSGLKQRTVVTASFPWWGSRFSLARGFCSGSL